MSRAVEMGEIREREAPASQTASFDRVLEFMVLGALLTTVVTYIAAVFLVVGWSQRPFIGAFVEQTLIFNGIGDPNHPAWSARGRVPAGHQLLAIEGVPVANASDMGRALAQHQFGEAVTLETRAPDGGTQSTEVTLSQFPLTDLGRFFIAPYLVGLVYLGIGWWVFRLRRGETAGRAFALTCALTAICVGALFDLYTTHVFTWAWTIAVATVGATTMTLGLVFPQPVEFVRWRPALRLIGYLPALGLAGYSLYTLYAPGVDPRTYILAWRYDYYFLGFGLLFLILMMLYRWRSNASPIVREQSRIIFIAMVAAFGPLLFWVAQIILLGRATDFNALLYLVPLVIFPGAVAYAILRYRVLDMDAAIGQAMVYTAIGLITIAAYALIIFGVSLIATRPVNATDPLAVGLIVFVLVFAFNPLRVRLQRLINQAFFRGSRAYTEKLEEFGRALTRAAGLYEITRAVAEAAHDVIRPAHVHVYVRDNLSDEYAAFSQHDGQPSSDIRFAGDGPLARYLTTERSSLYLSPEQPLPQKLLRDRARLAVLGSALFVPMHGQEALTGWLAIGPKLSGEPFSSDDLRFLESLADQATLAIERASVINDLERRVRELNVVSQMSQAVSFTVAYDDLLELIYAQTSKIVDARNFYLLLRGQRQELRSVFVVENNDRLADQENQPLTAERGLEHVVVRSGQPIRVMDYTEECHRRGIPPGEKLYRAWMGVPLNAGSETIGAMVVASNDPAVQYSEDQLKVFWTIADQAASAITKTRLYQQAEQRARQLATLNEISLAIASVLELDPLLQRVVQSSTEILNCEAGSLFLADPETGEYVFRVAVGPVGQNLVGMRIAPGRGFVGEAIEGGKVVIVNDVQNDPRWFRGPDQTTGFITRSLITVPLRVKGRPIGAIQLINKRDGSPFDENDQSLLIAFATPAAISIENARLFTQTDQALAARVEELSVMQRIGRDLNATLETQRVATITLNWAMRITSANAGWVGVVSDTGVNVLAAEGYGDDVGKLLRKPLSLDADVPGLVIRTGDLHLARDVASDPNYMPVRGSTRTQLTVPIKREQQVIGLVTLERDEVDSFTEERSAFVTRLADLASIALTNARLYAEVHSANIAKSEFVSFVAHELKTPMTSIKGYADLIIGGAVGQVNDMQRQFLTTIRGNVERMNTLVSDLSDVARIESGRLKLEPKPISFTAITDDVLRSARALIDAKKQTVDLELEPNLPFVLADYVRTTQVVTNLLSNAHKYTPEGGRIVLRAVASPNRWSADGPREVLHVSIQDTGIGIAPEDQKKLFQKFFRAEDRLAREMAPGTGLGLNIVKNLVELQGGHIWVESEFRNGSTFHFTLPLAPKTEPSPP